MRTYALGAYKTAIERARRDAANTPIQSLFLTNLQ